MGNSSTTSRKHSLAMLRSLTRPRFAWTHSSPAWFSVVAEKGIKLPYYQDGLLKVDFTNTNRQVKLRVISAWRDDCELIESPTSSAASALPELSMSNDEVSKLTSFKLNTRAPTTDSQALSTDDIDITLSIPEYCNLRVKGNKMEFIQEKKIQGDVDVDIQKGDMIVNKVRGQSIRLHAWDGDISVKTSIEGNVELTGKAVNIKMMNVDSLTLHSHHSIIEAIYSKTAEIVTFGHVEINHMQGHCNVKIIITLIPTSEYSFSCYKTPYLTILYVCSLTCR